VRKDPCFVSGYDERKDHDAKGEINVNIMKTDSYRQLSWLTDRESPTMESDGRMQNNVNALDKPSI
jgi:hypothetical protein